MTRTTRVLELVLGVLPATFYLAPLLTAGGFAMGYAIFGKGAEPGLLRMGLILLLWIAAGIFGLVSLWIALLMSPEAMRSPGRLRRFITAGLLLGLVAAACWAVQLVTQSHSGVRNGLGSWLFWGWLLGGPAVVAAHCLYRMYGPRAQSTLP